MKIKEALNDGTLSLEDNIDYADMTEEEYKQEIERLNNIIKQLEYFICNLENECEFDSPMWRGAEIIHNKLKELIGSDKE